MKKALLAMLLGSALVLAACGGGDDNAGEDTGNNDAGTEQPAENGDTGNADEGTAAAEQIAQNNCSTCHGADLTGQGNAANLTTIGSKLSKEEIVDVIQNGKGGMPPVNISDEDANTVASWLAEQK